GNGILGGTTISAINYSTNTITLSQAAFATATGLTLTAGNKTAFTVAGTAPTVASGQLSVPSVVIQGLSNADADFASYVGGTTGSFQFNTSTRASSLLTSPGATVMGD